MKHSVRKGAMLLLVSLSLPALASDDDQHGVGVGIVAGSISDPSANQIDFEGLSIYGRF